MIDFSTTVSSRHIKQLKVGSFVVAESSFKNYSPNCYWIHVPSTTAVHVGQENVEDPYYFNNADLAQEILQNGCQHSINTTLLPTSLRRMYPSQ